MAEVEEKEDRLTEAYNVFMCMLFGHVPSNPREFSIPREIYTAKLQFVQATYDIKQGDEDFLEWILTLVGRSPKLI